MNGGRRPAAPPTERKPAPKAPPRPPARPLADKTRPDGQGVFEDLSTAISGPPVGGGDDAPTAQHVDVGILAELHAVLGKGQKLQLALYHLPDHIVVGRGSACDWQLDDNSLSRRHAILHWDGHGLVVEDLGSANGTRVAGKRIQGKSPVGMGETIQLGVVKITLGQPTGAAAPSPDDEATRTVPIPSSDEPTEALTDEELGGVAEPPSPVDPRADVATPPRGTPSPDEEPYQRPSSSELATRVTSSSELATRVTSNPLHGAERIAEAEHLDDGRAVFRPAVHAAGPSEVTAPWDPAIALAREKERVFDGTQLIALLREKWRTNRRPFVLALAALWAGVIVLVLMIFQPKEVEGEGDDEQAQVAPPDKPVKAPDKVARPTVSDPTISDPSAALPDAPKADTGPKISDPTVTAVEDPAAPAKVPQPVATPDGGAPGSEPPIDREAILAEAVLAYDTGRVDDALVAFRRLAEADPTDAAARYMVDLIRSTRGTR